MIIIFFLQIINAERDSQDCLVDNENFIFSNRRTKRVSCKYADFTSPMLTCIDKISGEQIQSKCASNLLCQDVSEADTNISKLRCVEAQF